MPNQRQPILNPMKVMVQVESTAASSAAAGTAGRENETVISEAEVDTRLVTSCKVKMECPKLPKFSGDMREFDTFRSDFLT